MNEEEAQKERDLIYDCINIIMKQGMSSLGKQHSNRSVIAAIQNIIIMGIKQNTPQEEQNGVAQRYIECVQLMFKEAFPGITSAE